MFIKVALDGGISAAGVVFARTALATVVLAPIAWRMGALEGLRDRAAAILFLAPLQVAVPFLLISEGEHHISSSLAGILVAAAPLFTFLLAMRIDRDDRARGAGLLGVALGIVGVVMLLGIDTSGDSAALLGGAMVILASLGYALGAFYLKRNLTMVRPMGIVTATMGASALMTLPFALLTLPSHAPGLAAIGSLATLGVLGTGLAFVLYYTLIAEVGPSRSSLVAYVAPGFAVLYGVLLLGESFTAVTAAGLVLILGGSWLAVEGRLPWKRRMPLKSSHSTAPEAAR